MHSGRVPAMIRTTFGVAAEPVSNKRMDTARDRSTRGDERYGASRIANARKRTAEVICLAERTATLVGKSPRSEAGLNADKLAATASGKCNKSFQRASHIFDVCVRVACDVRYKRYGIVIRACPKLANCFCEQRIFRGARRSLRSRRR